MTINLVFRTLDEVSSRGVNRHLITEISIIYISCPFVYVPKIEPLRPWFGKTFTETEVLLTVMQDIQFDYQTEPNANSDEI